jgi:hypothetical protein
VQQKGTLGTLKAVTVVLDWWGALVAEMWLMLGAWSDRRDLDFMDGGKTAF